MDSYGDGNVYRGQVCKDPEIKTIEINRYNADVERLVEAANEFVCAVDKWGASNITIDRYVEELRSNIKPFKEVKKNG